MKKVLKKILEWLLVSFISFAFVFITLFAIKNGGIINAIYYKISTIEKPIVYSMDSKNLEEASKRYQELADKAFEIDENSNEKILELNQLYKKYPVGTTLLLNKIAELESNSYIYITSIIYGVSAGTIIFVIIFITRKIKQRKENKS